MLRHAPEPGPSWRELAQHPPSTRVAEITLNDPECHLGDLFVRHTLEKELCVLAGAGTWCGTHHAPHLVRQMHRAHVEEVSFERVLEALSPAHMVFVTGDIA
jgi:hypothetical protein